MCLSVYGSQSLDDLEALVKEKFAAVPKSHLPPAHIPSKRPMHELSVCGVCVRVSADLVLSVVCVC